jgi:hypothetical protein
MARPLGSKNKTPQELKIDADIMKKKAETKILELKRKELMKERQGAKNGK